MRVLQFKDKELVKLMQAIGVDPYGIKIMVPKAVEHVIKISSLPCVAANILKQEMLSLGGDVAVSRGALTGKIKNTDCLVLGNLSQYNRLHEKLKKQPFGLDKIAVELSRAIANYRKDSFSLDLGKFKLKLGSGKPLIWGILNLTPDSFSGDGLYSSAIEKVIEFVENMVNDGADVIDIGGESSRPGSMPISAKEELSRVIPVIKKLAKRIKVPISIDTYKPEVAACSLDSGASIVNDITALSGGRKISGIIKKYQAAIVLMHMQGKPRGMQRNPRYVSVLDEIIGYLKKKIDLALEYGIDKDKIIIDPGIGFGKTLQHNLEILNNLREFKILGLPLLVGPSRKAFIGKVLNVLPQERLFGTISACVLAIKNGANFVRVHDVKEVKQALKLAEAINNI